MSLSLISLSNCSPFLVLADDEPGEFLGNVGDVLEKVEVEIPISHEQGHTFYSAHRYRCRNPIQYEELHFLAQQPFQVSPYFTFCRIKDLLLDFNWMSFPGIKINRDVNIGPLG